MSVTWVPHYCHSTVTLMSVIHLLQISSWNCLIPQVQLKLGEETTYDSVTGPGKAIISRCLGAKAVCNRLQMVLILRKHRARQHFPRQQHFLRQGGNVGCIFENVNHCNLLSYYLFVFFIFYPRYDPRLYSHMLLGILHCYWSASQSIYSYIVTVSASH